MRILKLQQAVVEMDDFFNHIIIDQVVMVAVFGVIAGGDGNDDGSNNDGSEGGDDSDCGGILSYNDTNRWAHWFGRYQ